MSLPLQPFIGQICQSAEIRLAASLRLNFAVPAGWADRYPPHVQSYSGAWRILDGEAVIAGIYDVTNFESGIEAALARLGGMRLIAVEMPALRAADTILTLSDSVRVEFLELSRCDAAWIAHMPDRAHIECGPGRTWGVESQVSELTEAERRIADHAEACWRRWKDRVPTQSQTGSCHRCANFLEIEGGFQFHDLGVCSNGASLLDRQVVARQSGCTAFNVRLDPPRRSPFVDNSN